METLQPITVEITVSATIENAWNLWTTAAHIQEWNNPSEDWQNRVVELDLKTGGSFFFRMEARDGSEGFNYCGKYDTIIPNERIELTTSDGRKAINIFAAKGDNTIITETFDPDTNTPIDIQTKFCSGVLNSFKKYAENKRIS